MTAISVMLRVDKMIKYFAAASLLITLVTTSSARSPTDPVVTTAVVDAPVGKVWEAFTTKAGIESWMTAKTEIELKIGSTWRTSYAKDSNLNDEKSIHHTILAFDPNRMFSFRTIKVPKGFPYPEAIAKTWCVVYFEPVGDKTRVTLNMLGYDETPDSIKMRKFFEAGNKQEMDALVKHFDRH